MSRCYPNYAFGDGYNLFNILLCGLNLFFYFLVLCSLCFFVKNTMWFKFIHFLFLFRCNTTWSYTFCEGKIIFILCFAIVKNPMWFKFIHQVFYFVPILTTLFVTVKINFILLFVVTNTITYRLNISFSLCFFFHE